MTFDEVVADITDSLADYTGLGIALTRKQAATLLDGIKALRPEVVANEAPLAWAVFVNDDPLGFDYFVYPDEQKAAAAADKNPASGQPVPLYRASAFAVSPLGRPTDAD